MKIVIKLIIISLVLSINEAVFAQSNAKEIAQQADEYFRNKEYEKAYSCWEKAAKMGDAQSQFHIGNGYYYGHYGVPQDFTKAAYWLKKAAEQGEACWYIAKCYYLGRGVERDLAQAVSWCEKALTEYVEDMEANHLMAVMYASGNGAEKDLQKAHTLIDKSLKFYPSSYSYLAVKGEIYLKEKKVEKARDICKKLANNVGWKMYSAGDIDNVFYPNILELEREMREGVDSKIPSTTVSRNDTFAFIIANESYKRVSQVPFAKNDGEIFAEYCKKTLGIPENNVKVWTDATLGDMQYAITKIKQIASAYEKEANLIFYYAGHGIPSDDQQNSYLLPIDGYGPGESSISLHDLYGTLGKLNAKSVFVILDACFSGVQRNGEMFASTRGVAIKPKQEVPEGNLIVLSAAQGDETAMPYNDKEHGLFSYFLLKKLQESKGDCTIGELTDFVTTNVKRTSITIGDKMQTPKVSASSTLGDWRNIKLK